LDWFGAFLIGAGLCLGLIGFQIVSAGNFLVGLVAGLAGIALLAFATHWEQKQPDPAIPIRLLQYPSMWKPVVGTLLLGLATNSAVVYLPLYLQKIFFQTAAETGFALLPMLLMAGIASGAGGSLTNRYPRQTQAVAWLLIIIGFILLAIFRVENILVMVALIGTGLGLLFPIYLHSAQQTGGKTHLATASGLIQMARNMGGAMGIPLLGAWLVMGEQNTTAFASIFVSLVVIGILGLSLGLIPTRPDIHSLSLAEGKLQ
jgi:predicted MFS family arabinose efflux permease